VCFFLLARLTHHLLSLFFLLVAASSAHAQSENFQLVVSGELVEKLEEGTTIHVATRGYSPENPFVSMSTNVKNLPLALPVRHFGNRNVYVTFHSRSLKKTVFSILLNRDLFAKPRKINVKLDPPKPNIQVLNGVNDLKFTAKITQRMSYIDLPFWDAKLQKIVPLAKPPIAELKDKNGKTLASDPLGEFCMGFKWFAKFDFDWESHSNEPLVYSVKYDSGGLFPTTTTEAPFTLPSFGD